MAEEQAVEESGERLDTEDTVNFKYLSWRTQAFA